MNTKLAGMLLVTEEEFAAIEPMEDFLYIVKGENTFTMYLGALKLVDMTAVHSETVRRLERISEEAYSDLPEDAPETMYAVTQEAADEAE